MIPDIYQFSSVVDFNKQKYEIKKPKLTWIFLLPSRHAFISIPEVNLEFPNGLKNFPAYISDIASPFNRGEKIEAGICMDNLFGYKYYEGRNSQVFCFYSPKQDIPIIFSSQPKAGFAHNKKSKSLSDFFEGLFLPEPVSVQI